MAAVEQRIDYKRELHAGDGVTIRSTVVEVRDKAIRLAHELTHDETRRSGRTHRDCRRSYRRNNPEGAPAASRRSRPRHSDGPPDGAARTVRAGDVAGASSVEHDSLIFME